ncbi:hypothetical protein EON65_53475, partial [archaeon]
MFKILCKYLVLFSSVFKSMRIRCVRRVQLQLKIIIIQSIDVEEGLKEKAAARVLEESTSQLNFYCSFTVVPNAFVALECTQHTCYDLIISRLHLAQLNAAEMIKILRNVGCQTPLVVMLDKGEDSDLLLDPTIFPLIFDTVQRPLQTAKLLNLIEAVALFNPRSPLSSPRDLPKPSIAPRTTSQSNLTAGCAAALTCPPSPISVAERQPLTPHI